MKDSAIVFFHRNINIYKQCYLFYSIHQAKFYNLDMDVVLIGDGKILKSPAFQFCNVSNLENNYVKEFNQKYIHLSTDHEYFAKACFHRWFYLLEYIKQNNLKSVYHIDPDGMLYTNLEKVKKIFFSKKAALTIPNRDKYKLAVGHFCFWTLDLLEEFCQFVLHIYTEKKYLLLFKNYKKELEKENKLGGVSDMNSLYLFYEKNKNDITNLLEIKNNCVFDLNINVNENLNKNDFLMNSKRKKIIKTEKKYFLMASKGNKKIKCLGIHFQGGAKRFIKNHYEGGSFKNKFFVDVITFFYGLMYRILIILGKKKSY